MITIPLYIFLFLFFGVVIVSVILFGLIIYHLANGASLTLASFTFTFFICCIMSITLYATWYLVYDVQWSTEVFQVTLPTFFDSRTPAPFVE